MKCIYFKWNEKIIKKIVKNLSYIYLRYNFIISNFSEFFLVFSIISIYGYISVVHFPLFLFSFVSLVKSSFFFPSTTKTKNIIMLIFILSLPKLCYLLVTEFCWSLYKKTYKFSLFWFDFFIITKFITKTLLPFGDRVLLVTFQKNI